MHCFPTKTAVQLPLLRPRLYLYHEIVVKHTHTPTPYSFISHSVPLLFTENISLENCLFPICILALFASGVCGVIEQKDEGPRPTDSPCGAQTQPGQAGLCEWVTLLLPCWLLPVLSNLSNLSEFFVIAVVLLRLEKVPEYSKNHNPIAWFNADQNLVTIPKHVEKQTWKRVPQKFSVVTFSHLLPTKNI